MDVCSDGLASLDDVAEEREAFVRVDLDFREEETAGEREEGAADCAEVLLLALLVYEGDDLLDQLGREVGEGGHGERGRRIVASE
jgi:hypothetical protein